VRQLSYVIYIINKSAMVQKRRLTQLLRILNDNSLQEELYVKATLHRFTATREQKNV